LKTKLIGVGVADFQLFANIGGLSIFLKINVKNAALKTSLFTAFFYDDSTAYYDD
jgi:hypothetical protein